MKKISITGGCYNEAGNIEELYTRCLAVLKKFPQYDYEFVLADNCSTDNTRDVLRTLAARDPKFKVILNANNFGHIRSPFNALLNASGDAAVSMCTDLQEPPEVLEQFIREWENGAKVVCGVRSGTKAGFVLECFRRLYYKFLATVAPDEHLIPRFTGFGLYDRKFVDVVRDLHDPLPYLRGIIAELGFDYKAIEYTQPKRRAGKSKNNFYSLYDYAMIGITSYSKVVMRLATFAGFIIGGLSLVAAIVYLVLKLMYWDRFSAGVAPMVIGMFFLGALQLFFIGFLGEYVLSINSRVLDRPLVVEEERLNFEEDESEEQKNV